MLIYKWRRVECTLTSSARPTSVGFFIGDLGIYYLPTFTGYVLLRLA
jgi:hypothetical protein